MTDALLWPRYDSPADLADIERAALSDRGLPATTYDIVLRAAGRTADQIAASYLPDANRWEHPRTLTYSAFLSTVHRYAHALHGAGVARGDAVVLLSPNCSELHAMTLAAEAVGIAAPINPSLSLDHAAALTELAEASVIVAAGPELDPTVWALARSLTVRTGARTLFALNTDDPDVDASDLEPLDGVTVAYLTDHSAALPDDALPADPPAADDLAAFFHTGGTTGAPKLAAHTHANQVATAWMIAANGSLSPGDTLFAALPLFHVNALMVTTLAPLLRSQHVLWAGPLGYRDVPLYGIFWKLIERYRIVALSGVPTVYSVLAQMPIDADISSLRFAVVGASPLPPAVRTAFETHTGVSLCEGYGLTEATCASARSFPDHPRPGSVGQRMPYQHVRVVDAESRAPIDGADRTGELEISGPAVFAGYVRKTAAGRVVDPSGAVTDGWLATGDLARIDSEGFIYLSGRAKDLIIRGGHNIDPAVIEDTMREHPLVLDACAVGRPDQHSGEVPVVYVTVSQPVEVHDLITWAEQHIVERAAMPKSIHIRESLPVTDIGKPYKPPLRADATREVVADELTANGYLEAATDVRTDVVNGAVTVTIPASVSRADATRILGGYALTWRIDDNRSTAESVAAQ
jgi:fatty-acyl-CoA synthase